MKKGFFGRFRSDDGYIVRGFARNAILISKDGVRYFIFVEHLVSTPEAVAIDRSHVWLDSALSRPLSDPDLADRLFEIAEDYFRMRKIVPV